MQCESRWGEKEAGQSNSVKIGWLPEWQISDREVSGKLQE